MKCPLCGQRKGRRRCPAQDAPICSHCCGTKRRVVVACPDDCSFLGGAHAGGWEGRTTERERDHRRVGPYLAPLSAAQQQVFVVSLAGLADLARRERDADDRLVAEAVGTLRRTVETRSKGLIYEHHAQDARAQAVVLELGRLHERRDESGSVSAPPDSDLLAALKALDEALSATIGEGAGPRAFLETAGRIVSELARAPREDQGDPRSEAPRIILPG
jgi:hypothetical protein